MTTYAADLVSRVLVRCLWPATNAPLTDAEILALADDEITGAIRPLMLAAQGDWHLATRDFDIESGRAEYLLPASWGPIKDLLYVDSSGQASDISVVNAGEVGRLHRTARASANGPYVAYVDGDYVTLHPEPTSTSGTLRVRFYAEPGLLTTTYATISSYDTGTGYVELTENVPAAWHDPMPDLAIISATSPSHQKLGVFDLNLVAGDEMGAASYTGTPSRDFVAGNLVAVDGYSPIVQIPDHLVPLLVSRVVAECLSAVGDSAGFQRAVAKAADYEQRAVGALQPRNESEPQVIRPRRGRGRGWYR